MLNRLILKVTKFQPPPPKRLGTVVKRILGGHHAPPPMSNRVNKIKVTYMLLSIGWHLDRFQTCIHKTQFPEL